MQPLRVLLDISQLFSILNLFTVLYMHGGGGGGLTVNMTHNVLKSLHEYEYSTHFHYSLYLVLTRRPAVIAAAPLLSALLTRE